VRLTRREISPLRGPAFTYGAYFEAIRDVISKDGYKRLVHATGSRLKREVCLPDLEAVLIYGEKHGSDYHPARIEAWVQGACASFVMNVAITARGKARLRHEYDILQYLDRKCRLPFLPHPYFQAEARCPCDQEGKPETSVTMFLADWFEGYHEFHLSMDRDDGCQKVVVWDKDRGNPFLSQQQTWDLYRKGSMILTLYYDVETLEQIFPWHHAAGDFVVQVKGEDLDTKLVTARQYAPMLEPRQGVSADDALLLFFLNMSLRMRLDRLDGVGAMTWAESECLGAMVDGFGDGLRIKEQKGIVPAGFGDQFLRQSASLQERHLSDMFHALVAACNPRAPDMPVIRRHLESHIRECHSALRDVFNGKLT
jgi:hypothetical protein